MIKSGLHSLVSFACAFLLVACVAEVARADAPQPDKIVFHAGPPTAAPFDPSTQVATWRILTAVRPSDGLESTNHLPGSASGRQYFVEATLSVKTPTGPVITISKQVEVIPPFQIVSVPVGSGSGAQKHLATEIEISWDGRSPTLGCLQDGAYDTVIAAKFLRVGPGASGTIKEVASTGPVTGSIVIQGSPPRFSGVTPDQDTTTTRLSSITVAGQVAGQAPVTVTLNGLPVSVAQGAFSASLPLTHDGPTTLELIATDCSGRQSRLVRTVFRDQVPPQVSLSSSAFCTAPYTNQSRPSFSASIVDPGPSAGLDLSPGALVGLLDDVDVSASITVAPGAGISPTLSANAASATFTPVTPIEDGPHVLTLTARDRAGGVSTLATISFHVATKPPLLGLFPSSGAIVATNRPTLSVLYSSAVPLNLASFKASVGGVPQAGFSVGPVQATFTPSSGQPLPEGSVSFRAEIAGVNCMSATTEASFVVDSVGPVVTVAFPESESTITTSTPLIRFSASDAGTGVSSIKLFLDQEDRSSELQIIGGEAQLQITAQRPLANAQHTLQAVATDVAGHETRVEQSFTVAVESTPPGGVPDLQPTPIDRTVGSGLFNSVAFLYTGPGAVQTGVATDTMDPVRLAVLKGRVLAPAAESSLAASPGRALPLLASASSPNITGLGGVVISVLGHPEFGTTRTHADGSWDLAVNGGGNVTVNFQKSGYISAQRRLDATWQRYTVCPDLCLVPLDTRVTPIDFSQPVQVARGSSVSDSEGTRTPTLLFFGGTTASMLRADGTTSPLAVLNVRATEHTVGENGPLAMPAQLPPESGYTYCASFTVDEALAAEAKQVTFSKPAVFYQENFLGFPAGATVPQGYYDNEQGLWLPSTSGRVVKILSVTDGVANLDVDGTGAPASAASLAALGIIDAERRQIASLYTVNQSLWRVALPHLSVWDSNWGIVPPADAVPPKCTVLSSDHAPT